MAELFNELKGAGDSCVGVLYWDPCMIHVEDSANANESLSGWANRESDDLPDGNVVENTTLFDFDGKAIPTVGVFRNSRSSERGNLSGGYTVTEDGGTIKAAVTNNYDAEKKVNLYIAVYDSNGLLKDVKMDSQSVASGAEVTLTMPVPTVTDGGDYKVFLWNGGNFEPVNK